MKNLKSSLLALLVIFSVASCTKPGCTNTDATNFDSDAKTDDQSCIFNGSVTFWCEKEVSDSLIAWGNPWVYFEMDGVLVDSIATSSFFSTAGGCNVGGSLSIARDFTGNTSRTYGYRVLGWGYAPLVSDYVQIHANDCTVDQIPMP